MAKYTVHLTTTASLSVEVEVPDDIDDQDARERAIEDAFRNAPRDVCAGCSGWGQKWSLDLSEWDVAQNPDGTEAQPERQG